MDDEHGKFFGPPLFPLTFNMAYRSSPPGPCCVQDAERKFQGWCDRHQAIPNQAIQELYLAHVEKYLPLLRQVRWFQDVFIRVADLPGQRHARTLPESCDSCGRDYRIIIFSATLLTATLHLNLLPRRLVTEDGNKLMVRAPVRKDLEHLHLALNCYLRGDRLNDDGLSMLAELVDFPCVPGGHLSYLTAIAGHGSLFYLTHEIAHHFVGFAGTGFTDWNSPGKPPVPDKRARKWTVELTADIDGARLMHEALLAATCSPSASAIERVNAARMAFSGAMGTLEALGDIEALQMRGKTVDFLHDPQWCRHPPFIFRCIALRQYAENFSRTNLGGADMFEHVEHLSRLRGTLFEQYDPQHFLE